MSHLKNVEQEIREAMARGEFDNLPGKGKPIDLEGYFKTPENVRMAYHILKDAGYVPPELEMKKEIEGLKEKRDVTTDPGERAELDREIVRRNAVYKTALEQNRSR